MNIVTRKPVEIEPTKKSGRWSKGSIEIKTTDLNHDFYVKVVKKLCKAVDDLQGKGVLTDFEEALMGEIKLTLEFVQGLKKDGE